MYRKHVSREVLSFFHLNFTYKKRGKVAKGTSLGEAIKYKIS